MRRIVVFISVMSVLLLGALLARPAVAQEEPGQIARVYHVKPRAGMELQFEEAFKQHIDWHRQQGDTWTWNTWFISTGKRFGQYAVGTFGHRWADFDNPGVDPEADAAHYLANVAPYVQSVTSLFGMVLPNVSRPPEGKGPSPLASLIHIYVKVGAEEKFMHAIGKVSKALEKGNWPGRYLWYALVNGGKHPQFVLVLPRENWASFKEPEKPVGAALEEVYGRQGADSLRMVFRKTIRSEWSEVLEYRPDLSYAPASE
ncbi:MAG: hypothetical protein ACE5H2_09270 [Terriglobia bacterium]